jgi:hypothetical protein
MKSLLNLLKDAVFNHRLTRIFADLSLKNLGRESYRLALRIDSKCVRIYS